VIKQEFEDLKSKTYVDKCPLVSKAIEVKNKSSEILKDFTEL